MNTDLITKQRDQVDREADNTGMHLEVKLGPILDTLLRYNTSLERDLGRTVELLRRLQRPEHED